MKTMRTISWIRRMRRIKGGPYRDYERRAAQGLEGVSSSPAVQVSNAVC
jgi:hypothetical protein